MALTKDIDLKALANTLIAPDGAIRKQAFLTLLTAILDRLEAARPVAEENNGVGHDTVHAYGAVGDGHKDDTAALQAAVDASAGRHRLLIPPGEYIISRPLVIPSNSRIRGMGAASSIRNINDHPNSFFRSTFVLGNHHPWAFNPEHPEPNRYPKFSLNGPAQDSSLIRLDDDTARKLRQFSYCFVASEEALRLPRSGKSAGASLVPRFGFLTQIRLTDNNELTLDFPLEHVSDKICIYAVSGIDPFTTTPWYVCNNTKIEDIAITAAHFFGRSCTRNCSFDNILVSGADTLVSGNAFTNTNISNIVGSFRTSMIEIKGMSRNLSLANVIGTADSASGDRPFPAISIGEASTDVWLQRIMLTLPTSYPWAIPACQVQESRNVTITGSTFRSLGRRRAPIIHVANGAFPGQARNFSLRDSTLERTENASLAILVGDDLKPYSPTGVEIRGNRFVSLSLTPTNLGDWMLDTKEPNTLVQALVQ